MISLQRNVEFFFFYCLYAVLCFVFVLCICCFVTYFFRSEFIREDGEEKFWQFVDTVKELTVYKNGGND